MLAFGMPKAQSFGLSTFSNIALTNNHVFLFDPQKTPFVVFFLGLAGQPVKLSQRNSATGGEIWLLGSLT